MIERPEGFPTKRIDGQPLKSLTEVLCTRRATRSFSNDPVPDQLLDAILRVGTQAPSGYNLQPWRFIVVRDEANRKRLMGAAFNQPKVGEAPVVIIAFGMKNQWKESAEEVFKEGAERRSGSRDWQKYMDGALQFLNTIPANVWVNRHTMIAFTSMMLLAESYGLDTAPMEGFDPAAVKREFGIPDEGEVVALLAIGRAKGEDKPYGGRFELERVVFTERYGQPWSAANV
jgi:nitroreductase